MPSAPARDWFERLTGFREKDYAATRSLLAVEGDQLISRVNGARYGIGRLELPTLAQLRQAAVPAQGSRSTVRCLAANVRALHLDPQLAGALFQVASQFNLLEMSGPDVSPEHGVTRYMHDHTQGPACAMAAGAGTLYRNYFAPAGGGEGQTRERQIDTLAALGAALASQLSLPPAQLWTMRNGYALATRASLESIAALLAHCDETQRDALRAHLAIGLQHDVEVTDAEAPARPTVTQAYCSALPVAYSGVPATAWAPFASLVLEAAYEATLRAAAARAAAGASATVLLTRLGGGAFGNDERWIDAALLRALRLVEHAGLDVRLVSYGSVHPAMQALAKAWA